MSKTFSQDEVAKHNKGTDLYIVVDEDVYDLTTFQDEHPGMLHSLIIFHIATECIPLHNLILILSLHRRQENPNTSRWKRRLETILEIPQ